MSRGPWEGQSGACLAPGHGRAGEERESEPGAWLGPDRQRLRLAGELVLPYGLLTRVWVGGRLVSGLFPYCGFP